MQAEDRAQQRMAFGAAEAEAASEAARLRRALAAAAPARWRGLLSLLLRLGLRRIEDGATAAVETAAPVAELAEDLGVSERTIRRYAADLSELGLLTVTRPGAEGAREPNLYRLTAAAVAAAASATRIDAARRRGAGGRTCPPVDRPLSTHCPPSPAGVKKGGGGGGISCGTLKEKEQEILLPPPPSAQGCPPSDRPADDRPAATADEGWPAAGRERVEAWLSKVAQIGDVATALAGAERTWPMGVGGPEVALAELKRRWDLLGEPAAAKRIKTTPAHVLCYWLREGRCPVSGLAEDVEQARREAEAAARKERQRAAAWEVAAKLRALREAGVPHAEREERLRAELPAAVLAAARY